MKDLSYRHQLKKSDRERIREILVSSSFFHDYEIETAIELVDEALGKGKASGYHFLLAEIDHELIAYSCFGDIPCTKNSWDIYWIAVHQEFRGSGSGGKLLTKTEEIIRKKGGLGIYLETSSTEKYIPTQNFYLKYQYILEARIKDFYDLGDDKLIFSKRFPSL